MANKHTKREKKLPGFPWEGRFTTVEEIEAYFAGAKIQCLLCGKWYKQISPSHLSAKHDTTPEEYRQRYGLPWMRGLTAEHSRQKRSAISKQLIDTGRIPKIDGTDSEIKRKAKESQPRPIQPAIRESTQRRLRKFRKQQGYAWERSDYEAVLDRMKTQQRILSDVCRDPDLPGISAWQTFAAAHPDMAAQEEQIHFSLPYALQIMSRRVSPQFRTDCQRLRDQGMTFEEIAAALEVSTNSVARVLPGTKPVYKRLTIEAMQRLACFS
jgi:CRP-like cAMP-binding protein